MTAPSSKTLARAVLLAWCLYTGRGKWKSAPHLAYLSLVLQDVFEGRTKRVIIQEPPRHGKSELVSVRFPSWWMGKRPDTQIMLGSYSGGLAKKFGRKSRDMFREFAPDVFGRSLGLKSAYEWSPAGTDTGLASFAGIGGAFTGKGADLLLVDDYFRDAKEALSQTIRDNVWDWWETAAYSRLEPGGAAVVTATRWHEDDLIGRLVQQMKQGGEHWTVVSMPAIAEADEVWRHRGFEWKRAKGEALWPWRYPIEELERIRKGRNPFWFSAMYQQRPQPMGGGVFKREHFRYFVQDGDVITLRKPEGDRIFAYEDLIRFFTIDLASSMKKEADYFAVGHFALTPEMDLLVLDVFRDHLQGPAQLEVTRSLYDKYRPAFVGAESTAYQLTFVQHGVQKHMPMKELHPGTKDKLSRALPLSALYSTGNVYMRAGANWLDTWEMELLGFPRAEHDECVDIGAYAALEALELGVPRFRSA